MSKALQDSQATMNFEEENEWNEGPVWVESQRDSSRNFTEHGQDGGQEKGVYEGQKWRQKHEGRYERSGKLKDFEF